MSATAIRPLTSMDNPLDLIEEIVLGNEWSFDRCTNDELVAEIPGRWCEYRLHFAWSRDMSALQFSCALDIKVPRAKRDAVANLLALANEKLWLGHFDVSSEHQVPMFRHAVLLRGARGASVEQLEDLVDIALNECERFYPAFQHVIWGGRSSSDALLAACVEPVGEA